ncbi:MAG TPA: MmcQ/YjbR family DNA-binding protein [Mycobacteriales bacterium]|jgi:predicted DNA-binding protein (MmcQ/YjbR family)|nr:MmcQ/YjbR family DNA-binding protein [Mycobacteriales bacterium]
MDRVKKAAHELPEVTEEQPFREGVPVFKVAGKVFAIYDPSGSPGRVTLKCDPDLALELRAQYEAVTPGYHTNKRLWNTVVLDGTVPADEVDELIRHAWDQTVAGMTRSDQERLRRQLG